VDTTAELRGRAVSAEAPYKFIAEEVARLVEQKNAAYGSAFAKSGEILKHLYPDGVKPGQYTDMLAVIRILDKLFRIASQKEAFEESPYRDIIGYGILGVAKDEYGDGQSV
jgi:hypothetical protein